MSDKQFFQQYINVEIKNVTPQEGVIKPNTAWLISADESLSDITDKIYTSETQVAEDFATTTNTYKLAKKLFNNGGVSLRQSSGALFISKISDATGATRGYVNSATIDATKITAFNLISDGEFQVELVDGAGDVVEVLDTLQDLKFTIKPLTINRIASIINRQLIKTSVVVDNGKLKFVSTDYNVDAKLKISPLTGGSGTDITTSTYLDPANGSAVSGTDGTVDMTELLTKLQDMQYAKMPCVVHTAFMLSEAQAIQVAQKVKTLSNKIQFIYGVDARNPQMSTLITEMEANKQFWVSACFLNTTNDTGLDLLYLPSSIIATQLSQDVFTSQGQLVQLSGKTVDNDNSINLANFQNSSVSLKRTLIDSLVSQGVLCLMPVNDDSTYELKTSPRTVSNVLYEITNNIFVSMLTNRMLIKFMEYLKKNNILNNLSGISAVNEYLAAEVFSKVANGTGKPLTPFVGDFSNISLDTPPMTKAQQDLLESDLKSASYFIYAYKDGTQASSYFVIHTNFGLSFIDIVGNNITS